MTLLVIGLLLFIGTHVVPMNSSGRGALLARIGEGPYKLGFSALSGVGLVLIVVGFGQLRGAAADPQLWSPPGWTRHLAFALMLPAFVLVAAAYTPSRIRAGAGGHPMLLGIMLWALAHLLANGDLAGLILFGTFLVWAMVDRISAGRRAALGPLGRAPGTVTGDVAALVIGAGLYALMLVWGHPWLIGIPLLR